MPHNAEGLGADGLPDGVGLEHDVRRRRQRWFVLELKEDYYFSQCSELWDFLREKRHYKAPGDTSAAWHGDPTGMTCTFSRENFARRASRSTTARRSTA